MEWRWMRYSNPKKDADLGVSRMIVRWWFRPIFQVSNCSTTFWGLKMEGTNLHLAEARGSGVTIQKCGFKKEHERLFMMFCDALWCFIMFYDDVLCKFLPLCLNMSQHVGENHVSTLVSWNGDPDGIGSQLWWPPNCDRFDGVEIAKLDCQY